MGQQGTTTQGLTTAEGSTVFPLVLGGNTFGWTSDELTSEDVLDSFVAAGGNAIDTADVYSAWAPGNSGGESETILGEWLTKRGKRDDVLIATKVGKLAQSPGLSARNIKAAVDASLKRLRTDYIDLYYAHADDPCVDLEETVETFDELISLGKVRAIGLSNYSAQRIEEWFTIARNNNFTLPVALQPHYNLVFRTEFETTLAPVALRERLSVFPYYGLAAGFLTGKYRSKGDAKGQERGDWVDEYLNAQGFAVVDALDAVAHAHGVPIATVALAWLRQQATVTAPIASARNVEQLPALLASANLQLSPNEINSLDKASKPFARD